MKWLVGTGKSVIQVPRDYMMIEGFSVVYSPIHTRAFIFENEEKYAIISLELTSMPEKEVSSMRKMAAEYLGIQEDHIWVNVTHTFSAPHYLPEHKMQGEKEKAARNAFVTAVNESTKRCLQMAKDHMKYAKVGYKTGVSRVNVNRDVELEDGWWIGNNGQGISDKTVSVLRFDDEDDQTMGIIYHYALQSSVMDGAILEDGGKAITSDIVGAASSYVENHIQSDGAVAMFLLGGAGDQAPLKKSVLETFTDGIRKREDLGEKGYDMIEELGLHLGRAIVSTAERINCSVAKDVIVTKKFTIQVPGKKMDMNIHTMRPTRDYVYQDDGLKEVPIYGLRLGNVMLIGVQPELNCTTALAIRSQSAQYHIWVCTMINGAAKYMSDRKSYENMTYEAMNSMYNIGAAEAVTEATGKMVEALAGEIDV